MNGKGYLSEDSCPPGMVAGESVQEQRLLRLMRLRTEVRELERLLGFGADATGSFPTKVAETTAYALISEHASDFVSLHAPNGEYRFASPNVERLFGWTAEEMLGHSAYEFFHPDDLTRVAADHVAHAHSDERRLRYRLLTKSGQHRWVETRSRAFRRADGIAAICCFTRDIHDEYMALEQAKASEVHMRRELERLAATDALTDIPNRRSAQGTLDRELSRSRRSAAPLSIALFDLDYFKRINDTHGHEAGDRALIRVAEVLRSQVREADFVARWGGEEFLLILPGEVFSTACEAATRVCATVRALDLGLSSTITCSCGISELRPHEDSASLIARADRGLYLAKAAGRDCVRGDN